MFQRLPGAIVAGRVRMHSTCTGLAGTGRPCRNQED